jgi:DNA-binding PadR family transcriptional regulator
MGLVTITRLSAQHFRYAITDEGRTALERYRAARLEAENRREARLRTKADNPSS